MTLIDKEALLAALRSILADEVREAALVNDVGDVQVGIQRAIDLVEAFPGEPATRVDQPQVPWSPDAYTRTLRRER